MLGQRRNPHHLLGRYRRTSRPSCEAQSIIAQLAACVWALGPPLHADVLSEGPTCQTASLIPQPRPGSAGQPPLQQVLPLIPCVPDQTGLLPAPPQRGRLRLL